MVSNHIKFGKIGEDIASIVVKKMGYKIIERNYRSKFGEIDLIAKDKDVLVFIEIKTRTSSIDYAKQAIDNKKKKKLIKLALAYMKMRKLDNIKARFDVVAISMKKGMPEIEFIKDAFCC